MPEALVYEILSCLYHTTYILLTNTAVHLGTHVFILVNFCMLGTALPVKTHKNVKVHTC